MLLIIGFLFLVFIFIGMSALSGIPLVSIIDLPSALFILVPLLFFLFVSKSGSIIGKYIKTSFKKDYGYTETELEKLSTAIKNTSKFILGTGGLGFLVGFIGILMYLENREMLGPNLAVSLIIVFYAVAISFCVFFPAQAWAENKINTLS